MITTAEITVIQNMYRKTLADIAPRMEGVNTPGAHPKALEMMTAQNVLRDCMSVVMNECMPIDDSFCMEMAIRLASYAVSVMPMERQIEAMEIVAASLPGAHRVRMEKGVGIVAQWNTNGVDHDNMPTKGNTQ